MRQFHLKPNVTIPFHNYFNQRIIPLHVHFCSHFNSLSEFNIFCSSYATNNDLISFNRFKRFTNKLNKTIQFVVFMLELHLTALKWHRYIQFSNNDLYWNLTFNLSFSITEMKLVTIHDLAIHLLFVWYSDDVTFI